MKYFVEWIAFFFLKNFRETNEHNSSLVWKIANLTKNPMRVEIRNVAVKFRISRV